MRISAIIFFLSLLGRQAAGQPLQADFSLPLQGCLEEKIRLDNLSSGAARYAWDFCQGDLALAPTAATVTNLIGNVTTGIDLVFDGANWFGFVTSQNESSILRLDFGADLNAVPVVTNLGNIGGVLNRPTDIKIVTENGNWFGFVYGVNAPVISRINFGSSLTNTTSSPAPITADVIRAVSGFTNGGFDLQFDGSNWVIVLTRGSSFSIIRMPALNSTPGPSDMILDISNAPVTSLGDITLQEDNGNFYGYAVAYGSKTLQRLNFGASLFATPTINNITASLPASPSFTPYGIDGGIDDGKHFLFISTLEGYVVKLDLGPDLSLAPLSASSLGKLTVLANTIKLRLVKDQSHWFAFSTAFDTRRLFRISFPEPPCDISPAISSDFEPQLQLAAVSGQKNITLRAFKAGGEYDEISKSITVRPDVAPEISLEANSHCVNTTTQFNVISSIGLVSYNWSFHDMTASADPNPTRQYTGAGEYEINVEVTASNGCKNIASLMLDIYDAPIAAFTLPSGLLCTNGEILFANNTNDNFEGHLSYQWYVDGSPVSTDRDLVQTFATTGAKTVRLKTSIPGCSDEVTKTTSTVMTGPIVDFSSSGICDGDNIRFTSDIPETVTSYDWDFDDGASSSQQHPAHTFPGAGTYMVSLTALSSSGCNNAKTKEVIIRSRPAVDFAIDPPPQSCSNLPTPFINLTPDPADSDIASWQWDFGDTGTGNQSNDEKPVHTFVNAGTYNVTLTATTDYGCLRSVQKTVTITQSPSAAISHSLVCSSLPVNFTSAAINTQTYYWEMGTSYYEVANPVHTFNTSGDQVVKLRVKSTNLCEVVYHKTVSVPAVLSPDFSVAKNCIGTDAVFTDITAGSDAVAQQAWDFGGLGTATASPASFSFSTGGNKTIKLTVTGQSGCSYTASKIVNIVSAPVAAFTASPETGASPLSVQFTNTSTGATQYRWTFGDGTTSEQVSPAYIFQQTGDFKSSLKATNNEGCESTMSKVIRAVTPLPDVDLKIITISENADGSLKVIITLQNNGNTILRDLPVSVDISGSVSLRETVPGPIARSSLYNLALSYGLSRANVHFLCATAELQNDLAPEGNRICTELNNKTSFIAPYPNPATNILNIEWVAQSKQIVSIRLVDAFGKKMLDNSILSADGLNHYRFDTSELQGGIYLLILDDGTTIRTEKVLISAEN